MGAKKYAYVNYKMLVWARSETPFGTTSDVANHISGFRSEVNILKSAMRSYLLMKM